MIEVARGRLPGERAEEVLAFWAQRRALPEDEARRRLSEVVCVLRSEGAVAGVSSVYRSDVALIGGRRFWIYRSLVSEEHALEMIRATFRALDAEFDGEPDSPIGLCALIAPALRRLLPPEAEWSDPGMLYAGYLEDGRQARIAYFRDALIIPAPPTSLRDWQLGDGYRVEAFAEQDAVSDEDVVALWVGEAGLSPAQAQRRLGELLVVATDAEGRLVGMSTAYPRPNEQVRADLWHVRAFVASGHRGSRVVIALAAESRDHLFKRFTEGAERRGVGLLLEVESAVLKGAYPQAVWTWTGFVFIGENARGDDIRVQYFPGVPAPEPDQGRT